MTVYHVETGPAAGSNESSPRSYRPNQYGGERRRLWLNFSTPSEKCRRNILAGKLKRAILKSGGDKAVLEAEFATRSMWCRGKRVSGGGISGHEGCITAGCGWVNESLLSEMLGANFKDADLWIRSMHEAPAMLKKQQKLEEGETCQFTTWNVGGCAESKCVDFLPGYSKEIPC